jgi:NhaP-type Na+/H+ or K+/H+ antiporter
MTHAFVFAFGVAAIIANFLAASSALRDGKIALTVFYACLFGLSVGLLLGWFLGSAGVA